MPRDRGMIQGRRHIVYLVQLVLCFAALAIAAYPLQQSGKYVQPDPVQRALVNAAAAQPSPDHPAFASNADALPVPAQARSSGSAISLSKRGLFGAQRAAASAARPQTAADLVLGDMVIATTIEGGLYGIERATGRTLWTVPPGAGSSKKGPEDGQPRDRDGNLFSPLVGTSYGSKRHDFTELLQGLSRPSSASSDAFGPAALTDMEFFVVEPSSAGDIYVLSINPADSSSSGPGAVPGAGAQLEKLPLTVPQLVELSPFSFAGDDSRVFAGHKESKLVEIDVRTGTLGAVFGGEAGVWCGADEGRWGRGTKPKDACADDEQSSSDHEWAYIGRTDYTLTIHMRATPSLSQTLRFSTFAPNAADRDVQALWTRMHGGLVGTKNGDARVMLGMPEDGSIVCFNTSAAQQEAGAGGQGNAGRTLWTSELGATVAGVYDIIYPAAHLSSSSSTAARPIIVAQPPASLRSLFPATPASSGQDGGLPGLEDARGSTYLGIAGGSLYAMGSSRFPLVAFTPRAALGLGGAPASPRRSERAEEQPLAEHPRGLLGSYRVETDEQAETLFQEAVLGRHHVLAIGDGTDGTGRDKLPTLPDHSTNEPAGDGAPGAGQIPLSSSKLVNDRKSDATPASGSANSSSSRPTLSEASSWRPSLAMFLMQVCAVLAIALLVCAVYLGLQEQKRAAERAAASIARDVVWVPALKEDEAGFSIEASEGSERKMGQGYGEQLSDEKAAELGAAFEPESQRAGPSALPAPSAKANLPEETTAAGSPETEQGTPKKKPARRRKRGKRAGGANKSANSKAHEGDGGEGEADEDEDEEDGEEGGRRPDKDEARGSQAESQPLGDALLQPSSLDGSQSARGKESAFEGRSALANPSEHLRGSEFDAEQDTQMTEGQIARLPAAANASAATEAPGSASVKANGTRTGTGASLVISEEVLAYGSSGTVVFKGTFQGRAVAVKRLLRDFVNVASKEVSLLESADNHPNVIRYFYKELTGSFLFIALELCPASLADVIEKPVEHRELGNLLEPKKALGQITSGLRHLHSLSIVHRDIKPQNILVSRSASGRLKMLLSDFGLSKRLDSLAQTSFSQTVNNPGGTVGWRAPEILRGDVTLEPGSESSESSLGPNGGSVGQSKDADEPRRLTRAVDIFALGCLAYYVLSNGDHPFGSKFEREINIIRNSPALSRLDGLGEEGHEAQALILLMLSPDPRRRPSALEILAHPYFWDAARRLSFLQDASDRFEIMERDPPAPSLRLLEANAMEVVGNDWQRRLDKVFLENLGKFRKYDPKSVQDLLRAMRNKKHHYQDMTPHLKRVLGSLPDGFLTYFTRRFPHLFLHVYNVIASTPVLRTEALFKDYFTVEDADH